MAGSCVSWKKIPMNSSWWPSAGCPSQTAQEARRFKVGGRRNRAGPATGHTDRRAEHLSQHPTLLGVACGGTATSLSWWSPCRLHNQLVGTLSLFTKSARGFDAYERSFFTRSE